MLYRGAWHLHCRGEGGSERSSRNRGCYLEKAEEHGGRNQDCPPPPHTQQQRALGGSCPGSGVLSLRWVKKRAKLGLDNLDRWYQAEGTESDRRGCLNRVEDLGVHTMVRIWSKDRECDLGHGIVEPHRTVIVAMQVPWAVPVFCPPSPHQPNALSSQCHT